MNEQQEANEPQSGEGFEKIDSRILAKLNEFDATTRRKESCMSCGYVGVMGIGEEIQPWWLSWWCIVLIAIFGSLFMGAGLVIGAGLAIARHFGDFESLVLLCPNCEEQFVED